MSDGQTIKAAALRAAAALAPDGMTVEIFDELREIPPYDEAIKQRGLPAPATALRKQIAAADALLLVTPEYSYSVPGVLKNAIDCRSTGPRR